MDIIWDGVTALDAYKPDIVNTRARLANAAKSHDWPSVFRVLVEHREFVNSCRLGGKSLYTPLHQAAFAGTPVEVASKFVELGAWRTIQNAWGSEPLMSQREWDIGICKKFFRQC